jgi:transposase
MEQMQYNRLFRWFVGLGIDDPVCVPTVFTKNRDRLLTTEMSRKVMAAILAHRDVARFCRITTSQSMAHW